MERAEVDARIGERISKGREILAQPITSSAELSAASAKRDGWHDFNTTLLRKMFDDDSIPKEYGYSGWGAHHSGGFLQQDRQDFVKSLSNQIAKLESIQNRLELLEPLVPTSNVDVQRGKSTGGRVFLVHGRDEATLQTVARFVERIGLEAVVLKEQPDGGRTIVEKFIDNSAVDYAIVLMTPDDRGHLAAEMEAAESRARQNVVFELGFFIGKLGREKVCMLHKGAVSIPSDLAGVVYVPFDDANRWQLQIARNMDSQGIAVDLRGILGA